MFSISKVLANFSASVMLPVEEYLLGSIIVLTFFAHKAFVARVATSAESIPPESPKTTCLNPQMSQYSFNA